MGGKLIPQSLKTKALSIAFARPQPADLQREERQNLQSTARSKAAFVDLLVEYGEKFKADLTIHTLMAPGILRAPWNH